MFVARVFAVEKVTVHRRLRELFGVADERYVMGAENIAELVDYQKLFAQS